MFRALREPGAISSRAAYPPNPPIPFRTLRATVTPALSASHTSPKFTLADSPHEAIFDDRESFLAAHNYAGDCVGVRRVLISCS